MRGWAQPATSPVTWQRGSDAIPIRYSRCMASRLLRRAWRMLRYDLPEVVAPSSMPSPPHVAAAEAAAAARPRRSLREHAKVWAEAWRIYRDSFALAFPRAAKQAPPDADAEADVRGEGAELKREAAAAARAGAERARPVLRELYASRASAYRDGVREFVLGYRESFRDTLLQEAARVQQESRGAGAAQQASSSPPEEAAARGGSAAPQQRDAAAAAAAEGTGAAGSERTPPP